MLIALPGESREQARQRLSRVNSDTDDSLPQSSTRRSRRLRGQTAEVSGLYNLSVISEPVRRATSEDPKVSKKVPKPKTKEGSEDPTPVEMDPAMRTILEELQEAMSMPTCQVAKLNGKNYVKWKRDMTLYLKSANMWDWVTTLPQLPARTPQWTRKNDKALGDIHNACEPDQQDLIIDLDLAKSAWDKLKEIYETTDAPSIQRLYNEFNNVRKKSDETMATYIARVNAAVRNLISVGEAVSDRNVMNRLIEGLGSDYETLKIGLSLIENLTKQRLVTALLGDESRKALETEQKKRLRSVSPKAVKNTDNRSYRERDDRKPRHCTTCNMDNHNLESCFVEHPELLVKRRQQMAARARAQPSQQQTSKPNQTTTVAKAPTVLAQTQVAAYAQERTDAYASPQTYVQTPNDRHHQSSAQHQAMAAQTARQQQMWDYWDHAMIVTQLDTPELKESSEGMVNIDDRNLCYANTEPFNRKKLVAGEYIQIPPVGSWLMDTGASNHYTSNKTILADFVSCKDVPIMTAGGIILGKGMGNVTLHTSVGIRKLFDVMWVPELEGTINLLSIAQLARKGCKMALTDERAVVTDKANNCLAVGTFTGKGWVIEMAACTASMQVVKVVEHEPVTKAATTIDAVTGNQATTKEKKLVPALVHEAGIKVSMRDVAMMAGVSDTQPIEVWHMRMGHLNQKSLLQLVSRSVGMNIGPARPQTLSMNCEPCLRGAQHKNISHLRGPGAVKKLEHVWTDLKGPLLDKDVYGFRFFATFIDEFTRWTVVFPLNQKGDLFNAFKLFEARAERVSNQKIMNLHCDGGGEYMSNEFRAYCRDKGIHVLVTQPYGPEMNSLSERMMRTIVEHASAMLWTARLPIGFWSQAVKTAVFLYNRSPHSSLEGEKTPYEVWNDGVKPNLGHLKVFGCRASAHVPDELRVKSEWTSKASPDCIFIGYSETQNLFDLWDVVKTGVIRKRDVVFWEHEMGHTKLWPFALPHGVSIYPGVASKILQETNKEMFGEEVVPNVGAVVEPNPLPLIPVSGGQSIDALPKEPPSAVANELTFIPYVPVENKPKKTPNVAKPVLNLSVLGESPAAQYMEAIGCLDERFMNDLYIASEIQRPVSDPVYDAVEPFWIASEKSYVNVVPFQDDLPVSLKAALKHPRADKWRIAMEKQLKSLTDNGTWELVDLPKGRRAFPNKWVFDYVRAPKVLEDKRRSWRKELVEGGLSEGSPKFAKEMEKRTNEHIKLEGNAGEKVEKARLVARGDMQKEGLDYHDTFAPVVKFVSLRVLLTGAAQRKLATRHWDIVSAFLHGDIDVETYMQQPQGFNDGTNRVCRLKKAIYGLCQAARQFYIKLDDILKKIGYTRLSCDWAIWIGTKELGTDGCFLAVHVDDIAAAGTETQLSQLKTEIEKYLELKDLGPIAFYLGIAIDYDISNGLMHLSQKEYAKRIIDQFEMSSAHPVSTPMLESDKELWDRDEGDMLAESEKKKYQALVGSLLYLMHGTRPDICYAVIKLSQYASKPKKIHWEGLKRILRYLKGTVNASIMIGNRKDLGSSSSWDGLIGYFDSAHADNASRRSTCGYLFLLNGSPISWASKVQKTVALSTTEAEYMAGTEATRETIWIRSLLQALSDKEKKLPPTILRGDNQGALALAKNPVFHQRTKHIDIRHRFISECVDAGVVVVEYVNTVDMLADSLTKALPKDRFKEHVRKMGVCVDIVDDSARKRKFECTHCGNLFSDGEALKKHMMFKES